MRARHRHFKHGSAGASLALDTRNIHTVSDNTTVQTWTDASGNGRDATQATAANRPTYRTAIQGGNGILRFDGGDHYVSTFLQGTAYSLYCIYKRTGSSVNAFNNSTFVIAAGVANQTAASGRRYSLSYDDVSGGQFGIASNATGGSMSQARDNNWNVHSVTAPIGSGTARYLINGGNGQSADVSSLSGVTTGTVRMAIGAHSWGLGFQFNGDMGLLATYEAAHSASLRRRIEHAAAYSFKVSCN